MKYLKTISVSIDLELDIFGCIFGSISLKCKTKVELKNTD